MAKVDRLTDDSFEEDVLKSDIPVLVNFLADWSGSSLTLAPILTEVAEEYEDKIKVCMLNIDQNPNTHGQYGIRGIATLMTFKNGQPVDIQRFALN